MDRSLAAKPSITVDAAQPDISLPKVFAEQARSLDRTDSLPETFGDLGRTQSRAHQTFHECIFAFTDSGPRHSARPLQWSKDGHRRSVRLKRFKIAQQPKPTQPINYFRCVRKSTSPEFIRIFPSTYHCLSSTSEQGHTFPACSRNLSRWTRQ